MATELVDYVVTAGGLMGALAWMPRLLAVITKRKELDAKGSIDRFEVIMKAQDERLEDCLKDCETCQAELKQERTERVREREYFFRQIAETNARVNECHGILRRLGWKEPRQKKRAAGGGSDGHNGAY